MYGHTSGGALALDAVAAGLPITKLAVYEPPFTVDDTRPPYPAGFVETLRRLVAAGRHGDAVAAFWRTGLLLPESEIEQARQVPFWLHFKSLPHTLIYDYAVLGDRIAGRPLPSAWADSIAIPVLLVEGGDSPATLGNVLTSLAAILPNARKRTLAGQGQGAPADLEQPQPMGRRRKQSPARTCHRKGPLCDRHVTAKYVATRASCGQVGDSLPHGTGPRLTCCA